MPHLIDSHCHLDRLDLSAFDQSLDKALEASLALDVKNVICVCVDMENFQTVHDIALKYAPVYASVGKHPTDTEGEEPTLERLKAAAMLPKVVALGETGLDYYHSTEHKALQKARFITHIQAAQAVEKPLIIHTRYAQEDTLEILHQYKVNHGVFHCFTESLDMAKAGIELGLYISFSGILTFKNAESLREVVKSIPLERILVETDAPYLTPVPYRGKANIPGYTRYVAECIAALKGVSYEEVAAVTTENCRKLFAIPA